jgi:NAD(P)-dependent dehydrogenase (short-subunit alcohol dehydrogenase family)
MGALQGRRILITGAARGIGAATARAVAARGARVALLGAEPEHLRQLARELGPGAWWDEADVSDAVVTSRAVDALADRLGGLDAVFLNAGIGNYAPLRAMDVAQLRRVFEVNTFGTYHTLRASLPHLVESRGYALVNASMAAAMSFPGFGAYAASKAAVEAMADTLRLEVRHLGVDVGVCYFGLVATDMVRGAEDNPAFAAVRATLPSPLRRALPVHEVAAAVADGIARRAPRVVRPRFIHALLPLRWLLARVAPRTMAAIMPTMERLCAETDAAYGGPLPTSEDPEALRRVQLQVASSARPGEAAPRSLSAVPAGDTSAAP